jgi:transcriptional regulator with XRE-family HTH domain
MEANSLGKRIKEARLRAGLTRLRDLSSLIDVAEARVSEWENDRVQPTANTIVKIAQACGCTTDQLLGHEAA